MFLRISNAAFLLAAMTACSQGGSPASEASAAAGQAGGGAPGAVTSVPCALGGAKSFTAACTIERESRDGRTMLTLRHPDGGFRRVIELGGGTSFAAADGSDEVAIGANGQEIEVTLGSDHYLFPAAAAATSAPAR